MWFHQRDFSNSQICNRGVGAGYSSSKVPMLIQLHYSGIQEFLPTYAYLQSCRCRLAPGESDRSQVKFYLRPEVPLAPVLAGDLKYCTTLQETVVQKHK
uniref:Uncharacterized protein n=1 Tax=Romanomermis culicivorax TaxID=13658 RepID=A0A915IVR8_ROMCU